MGLTTKHVKRVWRQSVVDFPGKRIHGEGNRLRMGSDIAIAYKIIDGHPLVTTVLWNHEFTRDA